jgi:hypothetical protein
MDVAVTVNGVKGDPSEIRTGDAIEVQFAPKSTDVVVAAKVTSGGDGSSNK